MAGVDVREKDLEVHVAACRALFLEVIRRAAYDYTLYRDSRKLAERALAEDAYTWIFVEDEHHPNAAVRRAEGTEACSFLSICEILDLPPERVRSRVRALTPRDVLAVGRLPLHRRRPKEDADAGDTPRLRDIADTHRATHAADPCSGPGVEHTPLGRWRSRFD